MSTTKPKSGQFKLWGLGAVAVVAIAGGLFLYSNNQDLSKIDDATLLKGIQAKGDPLREAEEAVRHSLPNTGLATWQISEILEPIGKQIKQGNWDQAQQQTAKALEILKANESKWQGQFPAAAKEKGSQAITDTRKSLTALQDYLKGRKFVDARLQVNRSQWSLDMVRLALLDDFKVDIPVQYKNLPHLNGGWVMVKVTMVPERNSFIALLDGYNAPITAGNFVDLVNRGFYNGMKIDETERFVEVRFGDPKGDGTSTFIDPITGKPRYIPFEIRPAKSEGNVNFAPVIEQRVKYVQQNYLNDPAKFETEMTKLYDRYINQDLKPLVYGKTIDVLPALPFGPAGLFGMVTQKGKINSASSQLFVSFSDADIVPTGSNLFDGKYATFGYVTQNINGVRALKKDDVIKKIEVLNCTGYEFQNGRDNQYTGTALQNDEKVGGASTGVDAACLPLPKPKLVNGKA
jgi:peptidylprolyl isomerase